MGACTITRIIDPGGNPLGTYRSTQHDYKEVMLQVEMSAAYAVNGDTVDLTPFFGTAVIGAEYLGTLSAATAAYKWDCRVDPTVAVTAISTTITAYHVATPVPDQPQFFGEETVATDLTGNSHVWIFRGR